MPKNTPRVCTLVLSVVVVSPLLYLRLIMHTHIYTFTGALGLCSEAKGLQHAARSTEAEICPFPPGHVQTYELDSQGRASLVSENKSLPLEALTPNKV